MALDVKKIIASEFLELCEHKDLRKITIGEIQKKVGLSRQTFYKHFQDKDDLIQYCYDTQIVPKWEMSNDDFKSPQEEWEYTINDARVYWVNKRAQKIHEGGLRNERPQLPLETYDSA